MKPSKGDECLIEGKRVNCGEGFLTTQTYFDKGCDFDKVIITACTWMNNAPCSMIENAIKEDMKDGFKGFGQCAEVIMDETENAFSISMAMYCDAKKADCESEPAKACQSCWDECKQCIGV